MPCLGDRNLDAHAPGGCGLCPALCFLPQKDIPVDGAGVFLHRCLLLRPPQEADAGTVQGYIGRWAKLEGRVEPVIREDCFLVDVESLAVDGRDIGYRVSLCCIIQGHRGHNGWRWCGGGRAA